MDLKNITAILATNWSSIPVATPAAGIQRQLLSGKNITVCRLVFAPCTITPVHTHLHEQVTLVVKGKVKFTLTNEEKIVSAGDVLFFPPHVPHGATMLEEEVILIDIFSPVREDFLH